MVRRAWYFSSGSYGSLGPGRLYHGRTRGPASRQEPFSLPHKGLPVPVSCFWMPKRRQVPEEYWGPKYTHCSFSSDRGQGRGPSPWFRKSLPGPQLPSLQASAPPPQHWLGPVPVIFLSHPPPYWLPSCVLGLRATAPGLWGESCLALGPSRLLTAAGRCSGAGCGL